MTRAIVGNRATSGSDQRPMYGHSWRQATDGTINRSLLTATDRTSNRGILRPSVRSIVAQEDRWYDQSWGQRSISRSIVASCDRSYKQSFLPKTDLRSIVAPHDLESQVRSFEHDHPPCYDWFCPCDHSRSPTTSATSRTTSATSRTFFQRFVHDSNMFQSQVWRNLVGSPEADSIIP